MQLIIGLLMATLAHGSFSEMDLIVRESVAEHHRSYGRDYEVDSFSYPNNPVQKVGMEILVHSQGRATFGSTRRWFWFDCETRLLKIDQLPVTYRVLSTECVRVDE